MTTILQPYYEALQHVLDTGLLLKNERTGIHCTYLVGAHLEFDVRKFFPAPTRKKFFFKSCLGELLGFFRGYTSAADFRSVGTKVWDGNANKTKAWLSNPYRKGEDDTGATYGKQWTSWENRRIANDDADRDYLIGKGFEVEMEGKDGRFAMLQKINQLENVVRTILTNPSDRRIILSGWNIGEIDMMSLPPCHMTYTFTPHEDGSIDLECAMRSWDMFLAFNVQLATVFLAVVARLTGRTSGMVVLNATNYHLYSNGVEAAKLMLSRDDRPEPTLVLSDNIKQVSLDEIKGCFERINPEDIWLEGYTSHDAIKVEMAA